MNKQLHDRIKAMAAELRQEIYGASGAPRWGTKFTEIEDAGVEVGDALARELIGQELEAQAAEAVSASALACTVCSRDGEKDDVEPRVVQTRRGDAVWREPKGLCKHCRKAFFPSIASLGD